MCVCVLMHCVCVCVLMHEGFVCVFYVTDAQACLCAQYEIFRSSNPWGSLFSRGVDLDITAKRAKAQEDGRVGVWLIN